MPRVTCQRRGITVQRDLHPEGGNVRVFARTGPERLRYR